MDDIVTIDNPSLAGKDIIIRQGHAFIDKSMYNEQLKVFVMKGNLIMDTNISPSDLRDFDAA
jgi:hypothetical protein